MPRLPPQSASRRAGRPAARWRAFGVAIAICFAAPARLAAGTVEDGHETTAISWRPAGVGIGVVEHARVAEAAHRGSLGERLVVDAATATTVSIETPIGPAAVIDELAASVSVRASRPSIRLSARVQLASRSGSGEPIAVLVPGTVTRDIGHWERLEVADIPRELARQLPALRLEHGSDLSAEGATVTGLVLDFAAGPGRHSIAIDDLSITGLVRLDSLRDPLVQPAAAVAEPADPPAGLTRGVLEVDGLPFFPRAIDWSGERFHSLAELGFNAVRLATPASREQLADARAAGLWVICPPPPIPDVDLTEPERVPLLRNWDRVLAWDLGTGLSEASIDTLAEQGRRVRACDPRPGRPLIGSADSGLRAVSRHVDMLVARRTVLGTSLELVDWLEWLRQRPRLARPGTPFLATLATEIDPAAARQAAALAGVGGRGLAIDPESLTLAAFSAVAGGVRGILFTSSRRLDGDDAEARIRAAAVREMNRSLVVLEPWAAAGRFASRAKTSSPEVQAFVMEAARARVVLIWRCVQGSQIVARRYEGADLPGEDTPLSILVPGVPEAHRAWEVAPGGLRPVRQQRVTGGVSVTLDDFTTHGIVLLSGEPALTARVQGQLRTLAPLELASARELAAVALAGAGDLLGRLPPQALSGPPPVAAVAMLGEAGRLAAAGEAAIGGDPVNASRSLRKAAAIVGQFERRIWENAVKAEGSMVASPLTCSDATLAEAWQFVAAKGGTVPGEELLAGGAMEDLGPLADGGWRHFARPQGDIRTAVEVSRSRPASGQGCLRLVAAPATAEDSPVVLETPPVWITTPPLAAPAGKLVEISAQVMVPQAITGSVDGLLVFDSLGGPALAERVGPTGDWRRLVLHRIVPPEAAGEPLIVTFALSGLGEARIDDVSVRTLERPLPGTPAGGTPATLVSTPRQPGGFPSPAELLGPAAPPAPQAPPPAAPTSPAAAAAWPGTSLGWPKLLPFGDSGNEPPPGPGGGTIDPFKRARGGGSAAP
jgi:transposase